MPDQPIPSDTDLAAAEILDYVRTTYGLDARHVGLVPGREHAEAIVHRVDAPGGAYFLKLTPARQPAPSPLARYLADAGIPNVVAPLRTRDGRLSAPFGDLQATLYPYVEGENGFQKPLNEAQWTALGRTMRAIHDMKLPSSISDGMRRETWSDVWRTSTRRYLAAPPSGHRDDAVARQLVALLALKRQQIIALVEHAEQLAPALRRKALPEVPCHGDLHAGNVLLTRDGSLTIVDWDDPVLAPRERDLMFIGAGIGGVWHREEESAAFYRGYRAVTVDAEALAYYRCERFVEDVAVFCDQLLLDEGDGHIDRELMLSKFTSAFDPNDVVEIAERAFAAL
jgi:spectinomycin phosphotransferase